MSCLNKVQPNQQKYRHVTLKRKMFKTNKPEGQKIRDTLEIKMIIQLEQLEAQIKRKLRSKWQVLWENNLYN